MTAPHLNRETLLPCPFCGDIPEDIGVIETAIYCTTCATRVVDHVEKDDKEFTAVEAWNRRAGSSADGEAQKEIERLRGLLKEWLGLYDTGMMLSGYVNVREAAERTRSALAACGGEDSK